MTTITKKRLSFQELNALTDKLLSYRQVSYESGVESKVNLIIGISIPDSQDFITILFLDHTSTLVWLDDGRLPEINYQADARPDLPVLSPRFRK